MAACRLSTQKLTQMIASAQEDLADSDIGSSTNLQFPTIPVAGTPASWLSQSLLIQPQLVRSEMASQNDADSSCDEATSSLGDSTYDFVDDKSTTTDDEEGDRMTESTSSEGFEADRPVVVPAPQHTPSHILTEGHDTDLDNSPFDVKTPTYTEDRTDAPESSTAMRGSQQFADNPDEPIEFEEPSVINLNTSRFIEVSHTLRIIDEHHQATGKLQELVKGIPEGRIHVTVRQTMTSHSLDLKGKPYKVLFIGDRSMREPIIQKLGGVLAANVRPSTPEIDDARPTRFNIVPVSAFGDSRHPEVVLIDASGLEMSVEDCTSARYLNGQDGKDTLILRMANGSTVHSWWKGSEYALSAGWILPDLALFCTSEDEAPSAKQAKVLAKSFMDRHSVPSIIIQKQATWDKHTNKATMATLDYLTPHFCLEYQQPSTYHHLPKSRYPIDLATFLSIDAGQLNRNLACLAVSKRLTGPLPNPQTIEEKRSGNVWYSDAVDVFREIGRRVISEDLTSFLPILLVILVSTIPLMFWGSFSSNTSLLSTGQTSSGAPILSGTSLTTPLATTQPSLSSTSIMIGSSASSAPSHMPLSKVSSSNTDIASFLIDAYTIGPNKSDKPMVRVLGDRHIVVNAPRWLRKAKKASTPVFRVSRQNWTIEHVLSTLGEGVYALQIPHEEAIGTLNVSMIINSKGVLPEEFEVDFGPCWLNMAAWKRVTRATSARLRDDISIVRTGLTIVYNQTKTELSTFVQQTKTRFAHRKADQAWLASYYQQRARAKHLILEKTRDFSSNLSHRLEAGQKQAWQHIQTITEKVSRSTSFYTRNRIDTFSCRAQRLARSISHLEVKTQGRSGDRLKNAQKRALKAWWKIVGVPQTSRLPTFRHDSVVDDSGKKKERLCARFN